LALGTMRLLKRISRIAVMRLKIMRGRINLIILTPEAKMTVSSLSCAILPKVIRVAVRIAIGTVEEMMKGSEFMKTPPTKEIDTPLLTRRSMRRNSC